MPKLSKEEHIVRHIELHQKLDELAADFIRQTENFLSETSVMEFIQWSSKQTTDPDEKE